MAKYYIQSGEIKVVVSAVDAEAAALFVVNQSINKLLPVETIDLHVPYDNPWRELMASAQRTSVHDISTTCISLPGLRAASGRAGCAIS